MMATISLIVAVTNNGVIGRENDMPWHLPADLAYFKRVTSGHPVIMGRKTHESIGRALPNRTNIVITRQPDYVGHGEIVVSSGLSEAIALAQMEDREEIFIIGGGQIFADALSLADRVYRNRIDTTIDGDTFFPDLGMEWQLMSSESHPADERNVFALNFEVWSKKSD